MLSKIIKAIIGEPYIREAEEAPVVSAASPPPETIEVPFEDMRDIIVSSGNARELKGKLNNYIIEVEKEKQRIHRMIIELEDVTIGQIHNLRERYNVPTSPRYTLKLPTIRGAEGLFVKTREVEKEETQDA